MNRAVIDLGTNTFSLLIFKGTPVNYEVVATDKSFVNLGEGGINNNIIIPEAMERAYGTIKRFVHKCRVHDVSPTSIIAFGTSALRNAKNGAELLDKVYNSLNLKIDLIDGNREAELVYEAVKNIHHFTSGHSCIVDIGGGSTEFSITHGNQFSKNGSFKIGLSRLVQLKELSDPLSQEDITDIELFLSSNVQDFLKDNPVEDLVGTGGSFETYYQMINKTLDIDFSRTFLLPMDVLMETLDYLIHSTLDERNKNPWIVDFRKRMISVAALKTKWSLLQMKARNCYFSPASLKEGVMLVGFG